MTDALTTHDDAHADVLMSRLIDGEATSEDERAFDRLAQARPELWRELALRHRDAAALLTAVERRLAVADAVELPRPPGGRSAGTPALRHRLSAGSWMFASLGWAAAIIIAATWFVGDAQPVNSDVSPSVRMAEHVTPEEQLRSYLRAPYVLGELDPVMLEAEMLSDGRVAIVALRRIQEVVFLDDEDTLPVDDQWHFTRDPAELRSISSH